MKRQGKFVNFMQTPDGKFEGYHKAEGTAYEDAENDIVPGEAALALVMMAEYFDDDSWIAGLPKYWEYYMPWFRERAKRAIPTRRGRGTSTRTTTGWSSCSSDRGPSWPPTRTTAARRTRTSGASASRSRAG
jgi:hypothetical protein